MSFKYYDNNPDKFYEDTVHVDMGEFYQAFLPLVRAGGKILDVGCGSGRDLQKFKNLGYELVGIDASNEMVKKAKALSGVEVLNLKFSEITWDNEFDGLWASASLLHVPISEIPNTLKLLWKSLKKSSPFFMSFKYGEISYIKNERHFQNYTEVTIEPILDNLEDHKIEKIWTTADKRFNRKGENWLNLILTKV